MQQVSTYLRWIITYRWPVIIFSLFLAALAASGLKMLVIESDYEIFFDGTNSRLSAYREQEAIYGRQDNIRIAVTPKEGRILDRENLSIIEELTTSAWKMPYSRRVDSLTNFPYIRGVENDLIVGDLFGSVDTLSDDDLSQRETFALNEPAVVNNLVSPDGNTGGLFITVVPPKGDRMATVSIADYVRKLQRETMHRYPNIEVKAAGSIMMNEAFFQASTKGTAKLLGIMFLVSLFMVGILLRSVLCTIFLLAITLMSTFAAIGLGAMIGYPITAVSSSIPVIIMVVAIADLIHMMQVFLSEWRRGKTTVEAIDSSVTSNIKPMFVTAFTTIIGFLCLNTADVPPYRFMGTTMAIGVTFTFFFSFGFLPACLSFIRTRTTLEHREKMPVDSLIGDPISNWLVNNCKNLTLLTLILAVISTFWITENTIDDSMVTYFDENTIIRSESEYVMDKLSFFYSVHLSVPSNQPEGISSPEFLKEIDKLVTWSRQQPEVRAVVSYTDTMKSLNRAMNGGNEEAYTLPTSRSLASQYLLLYELSLPFGLDLTNRMNIDKSSVRITIGFYDISNAEMRDFYDRLVRWMATNWPASMRVEPTSPPLLFAFIWFDSVRDNLVGTLSAVISITVVIGLAFRSLTVGLISIPPNILPALMGFGVWGMINGKIDIASSMVFVVSFGIVVDDIIHLFHKYLYGRKKMNLDPDNSAKYALSSVGQALTKTTLILTVGFSILATSDFHLNSSMGLLTALMIALGLVFDFTLTVFLLIKFDRFLVRSQTKTTFVVDNAISN